MDEIKPVILVVDDMPDNIALLGGLLKDLYKVKVATNGEKALEVAELFRPDLILLDIMMPVMDGYETCRRLKGKEDLADIPVIFLTSKEEVDEENFGFELGAVDYLTKPISAPVLLARVKNHLALKGTRDFLRDKTQFLEAEIARRMKELTQIQEMSIMSMAALAEMRDNDTGNHIQRTKLYIEVLAKGMAETPGYADSLSPETIQLITLSAPLHDIGKVGIPDHILLKPGPLTPEEFEVMKTHTTLGREAILRAEKLMDKPETFLRYAKEIVYSHHEKWNGTGYPLGLAGEDIPLSARLMAVADVYDALTSKRVYKEAMPHEEAAAIIEKEAGRHFDPAIVRIFLKFRHKFREIFERYKGSV
ncbi:two-component system response regulator [Paenibacillus spiritus]|uniref:Two-component system response regulator n=1 Tax=Paenibacillus spiritus TaxID=2496557 RepID=A0A5J5FZI2_9BACL|nr:MULTISPECIES: two-component system response regulator [Paenibacillus]KAA8999758.1 two-component system response regulator [Paenibacillus spiritus]